MILPDTSVWIQFLRGNKNYTKPLVDEIEKFQVYASSFVFGELLQGSKRQNEKEIILGYWNNLTRCTEENILIEAGLYSSENSLISKGVGLIDSAILLSAIRNDLKLWTLDRKLAMVTPTEYLFQFQ